MKKPFITFLNGGEDMGGKLQGSAEWKRAASCLELPSSVRREVEVEEIGQEEVETAMHKMKKGKATGADEVRLDMLEMAGEVGVKWTGRLLNLSIRIRIRISLFQDIQTLTYKEQK